MFQNDIKKTLNRIRRFLPAFLTLVISVAIYTPELNAQTVSGQERGAGSRLLSAFKAATIHLATDLFNAPKSFSEEYLMFKPSLFLAAARTIELSCAMGDDLAYLKQHRLLAYVKAEGPPSILLNCYRENPDELILKPDWNELLGALLSETELSMQSKILLAHEVLRTFSKDGENSYLRSGSIAVMEEALEQHRAEQVRQMVLGAPAQDGYKESKCWIEVSTERSCNHLKGLFLNIRISTIYDKYEKVIYSECSQNLITSVSGLKLEILNKNLSIPIIANTYDVLSAAKCFTYEK